MMAMMPVPACSDRHQRLTIGYLHDPAPIFGYGSQQEQIMQFFRSIFIVTLVAVPAFGCFANNHLYLTWAEEDAVTTMTVNFHSTHPQSPVVHYDTESRNGDLDAYRYKTEGTTMPLEGAASPRLVHRVTLKDLEPGTLYYAAAPGQDEFKFRTLPGDDTPIRIIAGGDMGVLPIVGHILEQAASHNPDLFLIGGDIAYANGELRNTMVWDLFLTRWQSKLIREDGTIIPSIQAIGNHEVNKKDSDDPVVRAPFYFTYFEQGGKTYFTRNVAPYVSFIILDTGHITPYEDQVDWLKTQLEATKDLPLCLAVYHVPLFPSHRNYMDSRSVRGRELWQPLFEEYRITTGLEHHDHTFKRTKPMTGEEVDPENGIVYLGDGSMGIIPRTITEENRRYLEKATGDPHFWVIDLSPKGADAKAYDKDGNLIDEHFFEPRS